MYSSTIFQNSSCLLLCPADSRYQVSYYVFISGNNNAPQTDFSTQFPCFIIHFCESSPCPLFAILTISGARLLFLAAALTLQCNSSHQVLLFQKSFVTSAVSHRQKAITRPNLFIRKQTGLFKTIAEARKREIPMTVGLKALGMYEAENSEDRNVALAMKWNKTYWGRTKLIRGTGLKTVSTRTAISQGKEGYDFSLQRIGLHEREKQYPDLFLLLSHFKFQQQLELWIEERTLLFMIPGPTSKHHSVTTTRIKSTIQNHRVL